MSIDVDGFLADFMRGSEGKNHLMTGPKGAGKTRTVVTLMQMGVQGDIDIGKVECITNVKFYTRSNGKTVRCHPPGVHYKTRFSEIMRTTGQILQKYGAGNVTILLMLDETQNYMIADQNGSKENLAMIKFMNNIRKFSMCTFLMTPTHKNLVPKIRNMDGDPNPGHCAVLWLKDKLKSESYVDRKGYDVDPGHICWVKVNSSEDSFEPIEIPYTSWANIRIKDLKEGQYAYDTEAIANLTMGKNLQGREFNLKEFLDYLTDDDGDIEDDGDMPDKIAEFFLRWDRLPAKDSKTEEDALFASIDAMIRAQARRVWIAREIGIQWGEISKVEETPEQTLQGRCNKIYGKLPSKPKAPSKKNHHGDTATGAPVYISYPPNNEGGGGQPPIVSSGLTAGSSDDFDVSRMEEPSIEEGSTC